MRTHRYWIFGYAILLHTLWAGLLLFSPVPLRSIPMIAFRPLGQYGTCLLMVVVVVAASVAFASKNARTISGLLLLMPQQLVLTISAVSVCLALQDPHYAYCEDIPVIMIATAQGSGVIAAVCHGVAILDLFYPFRRRHQ